MDDRPSKTVMIVGGIVLATVWIGSGVLAWQGNWWPLIVVGAVAVSGGMVSLVLGLWVRGRVGGAKMPGALAREGGGPAPRAPAVRGSAIPARPGKRGKNKKRKSGRR